MTITKHFLFSIYLLFATISAQVFCQEDEAVSDAELSVLNKDHWQGFSLSVETGTHFKNFLGDDLSNFHPQLGHDSKYWGEFGVLGGAGFKYARIFATSWYWDIKAMWTLFYPDIRWNGEQSKITLSSIPLVGKYISLGEAPGWVTMFIPILYFDIGYVTKKGYLFAIGSAYLWGLSPSLSIPLTDHLSMEFRSTIFLDRIFFKLGYHNLLFGLGLNYKF